MMIAPMLGIRLKLLEPLIEGDSLKILSPQGEVLLVCDGEKGQVFLRYDAGTSTLSLQMWEVVLSQKVGEWSPPLLRPTLRALVFGVPRSGTGAVRVLALWDGRTT